MIPVVLLTGVLRLASAILERIPEPDPEIREMRVRHRIEAARLRAERRHERAMARITRSRRATSAGSAG